jgi:hypothetical protein
MCCGWPIFSLPAGLLAPARAQKLIRPAGNPNAGRDWPIREGNIAIFSKGPTYMTKIERTNQLVSIFTRLPKSAKLIHR